MDNKIHVPQMDLVGKILLCLADANPGLCLGVDDLNRIIKYANWIKEDFEAIEDPIFSREDDEPATD